MYIYGHGTGEQVVMVMELAWNHGFVVRSVNWLMLLPDT
jgi:hypothetical protein